MAADLSARPFGRSKPVSQVNVFSGMLQIGESVNMHVRMVKRTSVVGLPPAKKQSLVAKVREVEECFARLTQSERERERNT